MLAAGLNAQCPTLVWADEFNGNSLNTDDWSYQVGDGCDIGICDWGNNEQQWYQTNNVTVSNGVLSIVARQEAAGTKAYSSGRINTKNKQEFRYGYLEARIKVPPGRGMWPAFWMLPTDEVYGGWPRSGEIDIMEWVGREPETLFGTLHFGQPWPNNSSTGVELDLEDAAWSDEFHTYAVEWDESSITWFVDGYRYGTRTSVNLNGENWPFDQDFHFLLNLAVGGNFGGTVDNGAFPATMEVDYVRVYQTRPVGIRGPREINGGETGVYIIDNLPEGATITYNVPEGATVTPDPDNPAVFRVTFGNETGVVSAEISSPCGDEVVGFQVGVIRGMTREYSLENFDDEALISFDFSNGTLSEVSNPAPNAVNGSSLSGRYIRDQSSPFDVLVYLENNSLGNADDFVEDDRSFSIDIFTSAPPGTELLLQLESNAATPENFPTGRHSRFRVFTTKQNEWERLRFILLDEPDRSVSGNNINKIILLYEPNATVNLDVHWDNFDVYSFNPNSLGVVRQLDFPISATPNPSAGDVALQFTLPQAARYNLSLYDLAGKEVFAERGVAGIAGAQSRNLPMAELPQGVYLAKIQLAEGIRTIKVVRQ